MPIDNWKIMVPWPLAETLIHLDLSTTTLRLVFSMLHQLDLAEVCGPSAPTEPPTIWASCADLRARVGPRRPNGARDFHKALTELLDTGLLVSGDLLNGNTNFQWRFAPWLWTHMRDRDWRNYLLVDLAELGQGGSRFTLMLYIQMRRLHGSKAPQFLVAINPERPIGLQIKQLTEAARRVADILGVVCYIGLEHARHAPAPEHFLVKMTHPKTRWKKHAYLKFRANSQVWRVDRSGSRRFDPRSVSKMRADLMPKGDAGLEHRVPDIGFLDSVETNRQPR